MEDLITEKTANIISTIKYLLPHETCQEDQDVIASSKIETKRTDLISLDFCIYFYVPAKIYNSIKKSVPEIEKNIMRKAIIVFKWFPGHSISKVSIVPVLTGPESLKLKKQT